MSGFAKTASDAERQRVAHRMVVSLPKYGYWATSIRDFETPYGRIGYRQLELLWAVRHHLIPADPVTPSSIAAHFEVQPSVVTRVLAKLEAHELIARVHDPRDGRRSYIQLTDKGRDVSEFVEALYDQEMLTAMSFLDEADVEALGRHVEILDRIATSLLENRKGRSTENAEDEG